MRIFIDFDGTLTDLKQRHFKVYSVCVEKFHGVLLDENEYWNDKRANVSWRDLLIKSKIDPELEDEFLKEFAVLMESPEMLRIDPLLDSARDVLEKLSAEHELILISLRRNHENLLRQLEELGVAHYFSKIESGHSSTKAETLTKKADLIKLLGDYEGATIIGDAEADISAGKQLGIRTIIVLSGMRNREFIESYHPDIIIDSIADIFTVL